MKTFAAATLLATVFSLAAICPATPATPYLPYTLGISPELKKSFRGSDSIEVSAIIGTTPKLQVGGTYRVTGVCRQEAVHLTVLYVGNTADPGSAAIIPLKGSSLFKPCAVGVTAFDVTFTLLRPGVLHVTIYDQENKSRNDNAYAGVSLGEVIASR